MKIQRALLSVSDKTGLIDLARVLEKFNVELLSTGGTAKAIREAGIPVKDVSEHTGFPEMMDGRVKTLHPKIHGGLLFVRDNKTHVDQAAAHDIAPIDLVVVNLYPFEKTVAKADCTLEDAIENIDIGGPSMLRSAAKNHRSVTVIVDPSDYASVINDLEELNGATSYELRKRLAAKVFATTAAYDAAISQFFHAAYQIPLPSFHMVSHGRKELRYGENPHQQATLYGDFSNLFTQLHGKELSFNNILDISAATNLISEFDQPTIAILKHTNPCGVGSDPVSLRAAWEKALATDRQSPFGGIIVTNRCVDLELAEAIKEIFSEVIIAPDFEAAALEVLRMKKNLRLIIDKMPLARKRAPGLNIRTVPGGVLVQTKDVVRVTEKELKVVTKRQPTPDELEALLFNWRIVKHVKSNAIVYGTKDRTLGVGAGQMSRVDSSRIAVWKAGEASLDLKGSVIASDAFFPFADGLIAAAQAGATAAIQPGGSQRDEEVIKAADAHNLAMVFTGHRHFQH
ncbi:MAG: bifunctional phosphoribosylaminoimidazolecarboxamide formyltransferase/IMP cyclohydrolase [Verrucomicrobiota bacterium]|nr:bifunctional phosphoribosylaminoimidazolecarboxamide formyltransferase/IMP cyclohydrolase [Verrucomicrobiota bacterium]